MKPQLIERSKINSNVSKWLLPVDRVRWLGKRYGQGNFFKTEEEAIHYVERLIFQRGKKKLR